MTDRNTAGFDEAMKLFYRMDYCRNTGWNLEEIAAMYDVPIAVTENVLNKDSGSNYWYCYVLVIIVFMLIVYYGQMIAVSVTNEKSNRAIEVLVTSTSPNSLLFGKVIAGAVGGVFQMGVVLGATLISYQVNREQWGGMLDMFLHIPSEVLLAFAFFGLGGYLFYAFLYGAMGALVSKTEDISKSVSGLMVVIMAVYFFSLVQLTNVDGQVIRILSFLPVSSYSTMFARIAMGTVAPWEIIVSFLILAVSILGTGILGAKIYRMGTLRYGNPIKITSALKDLKKSEKSPGKTERQNRYLPGQKETVPVSGYCLFLYCAPVKFAVQPYVLSTAVYSVLLHFLIWSVSAKTAKIEKQAQGHKSFRCLPAASAGSLLSCDIRL